MTDSSIKKLSEFDITEIVYNTGVKNFNNDDLQKWIDTPAEDFLEVYVNDQGNKIERSENVLEVYYNAIEFEQERLILGNKPNLGGVTISIAPLYNKKDNKNIGNVQFFCNRIKSNDITYITCKSTYFIDNIVVPEQMRIANSGLTEFNISSINFDESYISRSKTGSSAYSPGEYLLREGNYILDNGLNKSHVMINIYIPINNSEKRRSIILNFDRIESNNWLPQKNYGMNTDIDKGE